MKSRLHAHIGTFRQLEILLAVYEHKSIKEASEALYLSQPTISMQLKKLAESINLPLYHQIGRKLQFTEAGQAMVETAREILQSCEQLDMELSSLRGLKSGTLKLAVVTTAKYFIPYLLGPFCEKFPGIDIKLTVGNRQQIIERLENGDDDFYVFSHLPTTLTLETIEFISNQLVAIAPLGHPLAEKSSISLQEFCQYDFLAREQGSGTRYAIEKFFASKELSPKTKMTIESNEAIIHSTIAGLGISILSAHTIAFGGKYDLVKLPVQDLKIDSSWSLAWRPESKQSMIAREFAQYVQSEGKAGLSKKYSFM
ncbi:MAG: LysR family transcriptional regulator [Gammaproteobacteria bacterium]|nr:LysR family transcriptional regulator [Gammaproteobacteria bacterium]